MGDEGGRLAAEMNRGYLQVLMLAVLEKPMYGYHMLRYFQELGYTVEENTLYPLLRRLEKNGLIAGSWDVTGERPRKFYKITDLGRATRRDLLEIRRRQETILNRALEGGCDE